MRPPGKPTTGADSARSPTDQQGERSAGPVNPEVVGALTVAAVARRLGVAPATLRTWHLRYGVGPVAHTAGARRRYQPGDVARLDLMAALTRAGVTPADAAAAALAEVTAGPVDPNRDPTGHPAGGPDAPPGSHGGGGRVLALPAAVPRTRGLARAAMALDAGTVARMVREDLDRRGVRWTWEELLTPVLVGIGDHWAATGEGVEVEHLLSECIIAALHRAATGGILARTRPVLLACAAEEGHSLPLHAVAAALAETGVAARLLGARVPVDALAAACRRLGPPAVLVWSHSPATGQASQLSALPAVRPRPTLVAAGPGWPERLPPRIVRVHSFAAAVQAVTDAVGAVGADGMPGPVGRNR